MERVVEPFGSILEETPKVTLATRGTVLGKMGGTVRVKFPKKEQQNFCG